MVPALPWMYVGISDTLGECRGCCSPQSSPPQELDLLTGDPKWLDVIERDLHRQFPFHEMFVSRGGHGYVELLLEWALSIPAHRATLMSPVSSTFLQHSLYSHSHRASTD